jgi:hypothetical protein
MKRVSPDQGDLSRFNDVPPLNLKHKRFPNSAVATLLSMKRDAVVMDASESSHDFDRRCRKGILVEMFAHVFAQW